MNSTTTTTNATTTEKKENVFRQCKVYIREHKEGPRISYLERETGYDANSISKYVRQLQSEGRIAYEAGNYRTMVIPRRRRQPTAMQANGVVMSEVHSPIVERRRALPAPRRELPPAPASTSLAEHSHLKAQLVRLREQWAERISAAVTLTGLFIGNGGGEGAAAPAPLTDVLAAPSQAVKDELVTLRTKWQACLDALDLVIAQL